MPLLHTRKDKIDFSHIPIVKTQGQTHETEQLAILDLVRLATIKDLP